MHRVKHTPTPARSLTHIHSSTQTEALDIQRQLWPNSTTLITHTVIHHSHTHTPDDSSLSILMKHNGYSQPLNRLSDLLPVDSFTPLSPYQHSHSKIHRHRQTHLCATSEQGKSLETGIPRSKYIWAWKLCINHGNQTIFKIQMIFRATTNLYFYSWRQKLQKRVVKLITCPLLSLKPQKCWLWCKENKQCNSIYFLQEKKHRWYNTNIS